MLVKLSLIVPVYNEEDSIAVFNENLLRELEKAGIEAEVVYVNDGSTDKTKEILDGLYVKAIHLDGNMGYGAAIKVGIQNSTAPVIGIIDCDGTYDPKFIAPLWEKMEESDMVVGHRPREKGVRGLAKEFLRRFASYAVAYPIPDLNSGLRLFRRDMAKHLMPLLPNGFSLTSTITLGALYVPYRVRYVPIDYYKRNGSSKIKPLHAFSSFAMLIVRTVILFNPLRFFLPVTALFASVGLAFLIRDLLAGNLAQTSLLFLVNAFILLAIGLLAEAIRAKV